MINVPLYRREMKNSIRLLIIFGAVIAMYISIIIVMYDPKMMASLDQFYDVMPELMAAVGMKSGTTSLIDFMISYLYGFILLLFPMIYCMLRGNGLIAKYVDRGSMATLLAAPVKRSTIAITQLFVLVSGIILLDAFTTGLELVIACTQFPGELVISELLGLNAALCCLHLFVGGICFLTSCIFSEVKYSIAFGAGIPTIMYVFQMLVGVGEKTEVLKYVTFFTLFDASGIVAGSGQAIAGAVVLVLGAVICFAVGVVRFCKKDLHV